MNYNPFGKSVLQTMFELVTKPEDRGKRTLKAKANVSLIDEIPKKKQRKYVPKS